ncbi:queuine tRNA-ribosyltransferase catalytic subunit 1 [Anaeramoeba ignava]|uniref:Queuine tRNA-ribosyltransferase catalytic subunit 1 n=1 Tax=Anaeramoeba ignava TaxID=1746090 RepID=A0A9Q0LRA3_ANAIG|nr:queuine tRNA-ribosyltransferase catalytic subunit 1 [Anaeramoeba ignava]
MEEKQSSPLSFEIQAKFGKARASILQLPHFRNETPMFMPVATKGSMKGLTSKQLIDAKCQTILGNTYHLSINPGTEILDINQGIHSFMNYPRSMLTDSGGFQMVSLIKLSEVTEQGVKFLSIKDNSEIMLTPEKSIEIQNSIGADIMMQLDDVVDVSISGPRSEEAMFRSIRWLDRCIKAHKRPTEQCLFGIIQGGLNTELRTICCNEMVKRNLPGYAIGGLSGGESKDDFWKIINLCTDLLPENKPRYSMGIGFPTDLVVCCALGCDCFDCVYPTRTARFGNALVRKGGTIKLKSPKFANDFRPIEEDCDCFTCQNYTRAALHTLVTKETIGSHLLSLHNIRFQMRLMEDIRKSIKYQTFDLFVKNFMKEQFSEAKNEKTIYPQWIIDSLSSQSIYLNEKIDK